MQRKKWTPNSNVTPELLKFREKRKWQLALRRYVLEKKASETYAPYFGLDVNGFREWIELQFTSELDWNNFATAWQFEHIVPVTYFDFTNNDDLLLCWNFMNIRVQKIDLNHSSGNRFDVFAVKPYFEALYAKTNYTFCKRMIDKLVFIEVSNIESHSAIEDFIFRNKEQLETIATLSASEFARFNKGVSLKDILLEREILQKFGI